MSLMSYCLLLKILQEETYGVGGGLSRHLEGCLATAAASAALVQVQRLIGCGDEVARVPIASGQGQAGRAHAPGR